jgi:hypothetical protein
MAIYSTETSVDFNGLQGVIPENTGFLSHLLTQIQFNFYSLHVTAVGSYVVVLIFNVFSDLQPSLVDKGV